LREYEKLKMVLNGRILNLRGRVQ